jgi:hypothetical protein
MKRRRWRALQAGASAAVLICLFPQIAALKTKAVWQAPPTAQDAYWPDAGTLKGNLYTNNFFGFSVELPKGWEILDKDQLRTLQGRVAEKTIERRGNRDRAEILVQTQMAGAVDDLGKPGADRRMVAIFATPVEPQAGLRPPDEETLRHLAVRAKEIHSNSQFLTEPQACQFGGQKLWQADLQTTYPDHVRFSRELLLPDRRSFVAILLAASKRSDLDEMESVFRSLKFFPPRTKQ